MKRHPRAFTLIELLVVVTIIVALLALLAPAMDRAIYQAELAVCASRLCAVAGNILLYTMDFKRSYPTRDYRPTNRSPDLLQGPDTDNPAVMDDERPVIRRYISINKMYNDPLVTTIELENTDNTNMVYASYELWYGWRNLGADGRPLKGMFRLGDRWEWNDRTYHVLACDRDEYMLTRPGVASSHPDTDGRMFLNIWQGSGGVPINNLYLSRWWNGAVARGPLDLNFAYDDASVRRLDRVTVNDDNQTDMVCEYPNSGPGLAATNYLRVPRP
jgi:prepilin-type N-terminal cleavage/methylation domain-containing protein